MDHGRCAAGGEAAGPISTAPCCAAPGARSMDQQQTQERIASIIFDSISEGVFTTDRECRITSFNRAAERISGFAADEAIGRYCFDVFRTELSATGAARCVRRSRTAPRSRTSV